MCSIPCATVLTPSFRASCSPTASRTARFAVAGHIPRRAPTMVDINPAALSRPSIGLSTPVLSKQSINVSVPSIHKAPKTSQLIPARIDLEPIYTALKTSIGAEQWATYKESITNFLIGNSQLTMARLGQLAIMLTICRRSPQSGRIQRAHRTHSCLPRWLSGTPPQPAHSSPIWQCNT